METENQESAPVEDAQETLKTQVISFSVNDARIAEVAELYKDIDAYKDLDAAKKAKTALTKMRTTLGEAHKDAKADALAYGRRCDAEKNRLLEAIGKIEDPIKEQLDEIKNAEAREEEQRIALIMEGIEQIQAFALDRHDLTFDELNTRLDTLLGLKVDPDFYAEHTEDAENAKEVSESKLRIAIINEEARLKEAEEKADLEAKNKSLQEQIDKQNAEQAERDAAQKVIDDAAAADQKVKDDERQKELDDQAEVNRLAQKKIDDENARLAAEQVEKDRVAAEEKAETERLEAEQLAADLLAIQAPDKDKLELFAADIDTLIAGKPVLQSDAGNAVLIHTMYELIESVKLLRERTGEL